MSEAVQEKNAAVLENIISGAPVKKRRPKPAPAPTETLEQKRARLERELAEIQPAAETLEERCARLEREKEALQRGLDRERSAVKPIPPRLRNGVVMVNHRKSDDSPDIRSIMPPAAMRLFSWIRDMSDEQYELALSEIQNSLNNYRS